MAAGGTIAGLFVAFVCFMVIFTILNTLCRNSRASAAARTRPPRPRLGMGLGARNDAADEDERASAPSPTARLPAFAYSGAVKHNATGGAEEAATCSVCLGAFQGGEMVRLLPACLHLYHAECIDPWLDAHSTCPVCRSDTDPTMDAVGRIPTV